MRMRYCLYTVIIAALLAGARLPVQAQQQYGAEAQSIVEAMNQERLDRGLGPLRWDPALAQAAEKHAQWMAEQPALSHQYPGEPDLATRAGEQGAHFRLIEENVAMGPGALGLERQWMNSTPHRENILNPGVNAVGIGLVRRGGYYFGVADFSAGVASLAPEQIEQKVAAQLEARGLRISGATRDARQTCEMRHGTAGGTAPSFVMRWEGSDLSRLPGVLEAQIQSGRYRTAAVGACDSGNPGQGFTTYRIAVLLY